MTNTSDVYQSNLMLICLILNMSGPAKSSIAYFQGMLTHWTKKIIVEEGHSLGQLTHIL